MDLSPIRSALAAVVENRTRSALSALGIVVGTVAVTLLISIAQGVKKDVKKLVEGMGANLIIAVPGKIDLGNVLGATGNIGLSPFSENDAEQVKQVPGVLRVAKWTIVGGTLTRGGGPARAFTLAVDPTWFRMRPHRFSEGGPFQTADKMQAVLGPAVKKELFGTGIAVGKKVNVNGYKFTIIGVTDESESGGVAGQNIFFAIVYLPFDAVRDSVAGGKTQIDRIVAQTDATQPPDELKRKIRSALLVSQNGQETFSVVTQNELLRAIYSVLGIVTYMVVGISTIALLVGGVGIMTVMLMNVNERRKEIGIRKTVGARRRDIFAQFLAEAVVLTLAGGVIGLGVTWLAIQLLESLTPVRASFTAEVVFLGLAMSVVVGSVFGLLPAVRAASRDPVESMRQE